MATGKKLLSFCMPCRFKQGTLSPVSSCGALLKKYGNIAAKKAGHIRKSGQNKLRKQLKKELRDELNQQ